MQYPTMSAIILCRLNKARITRGILEVCTVIQMDSINFTDIVSQVITICPYDTLWLIIGYTCVQLCSELL